MRRPVRLISLAVVLLRPSALLAQKSHSSSRSSTTRSSSAKAKSSKAAASHKSTVAASNSKGQIKRSASARSAFMKQTGYPKGRKGYVVDHKIPLECGGADAPSNMQWRTVQESKIKDRTETNCRR
jgi:hypothetical protein